MYKYLLSEKNICDTIKKLRDSLYICRNRKHMEVISMADEKEKFDATKYKNDFQKEKYDRIIVNVAKGQKKIIDQKAKELGYKSLNSFIVDLINKHLEM